MSNQPTGVPAEPTAPACYRHADRETRIICQRCERPICPDCMRPAAVGFQCPECVREGARSTRSGRTAYGGARNGDPTLVSRTLVIINAAVFALILVTGAAGSIWVDRLALLPQSAFRIGSDGTPELIQGVAEGAYWQLVTSMFTHVQVWHIGFNMLALWVLGPQLEAAMGRARYLSLYLLSGLAGSVAVYWLSAPNGQTVGASGAIFGLMGALLVVAVKVRGDVQGLLTWVGINFLITVLGRGFISWQGHLGGFLGGVVLGALIVYAPRTRRTSWQVAGLVLFGVLLLLAILLRTAVLN